MVICLLMENKSLNLKATIKSATEFREVCLNGDVYDFSADYKPIDKSDTLNIWKYLMAKNNTK